MSGVLLDFLYGAKRFFLIAILCSFGVTVTDMITPQIIRVTIDSVLGDEAVANSVIAAVINAVGGTEVVRQHIVYVLPAILAVAVFAVTFKYGSRMLNSMGAEVLVKNMRDKLFDKAERLPYSWYGKNQTGDIIQRCTSDVETIKRFLSEQLTNLFNIVILLVMSLVFMFPMDFRLTLVALATIPINVTASYMFHKRISKGFKKCDESEGILSSVVQENLTGIRVVRAFGRENYEKNKFAARNGEYVSLWMKMNMALSAFWSSTDFVTGTQVMLILVCGAAICVSGEMTAGEYLAFISYNTMLLWPVRMLGRLLANFSRASVALNRICYIMLSPSEVDKPDALTPPMNADICFEHVSFGYDGGAEILHDVSFTIKAGSTIGILGGTGSGKSTLMLLLTRLYELPPEKGRITIGGVDIADIKASYLRDNIGMVLQEPFLFSRTIAANIGISEDTLDMDRIGEAARLACLDTTIRNFSAGYETFVGERGVTLSGGQKQRTAIARMLLRKSPVMVFDDSLSAVDTETDSKIRHALTTAMAGSTSVFISHRITTLMRADKIIVLEGGRLVEEGNHEQLAKAGGIYARVLGIQTRYGEEGNS